MSLDDLRRLVALHAENGTTHDEAVQIAASASRMSYEAVRFALEEPMPITSPTDAAKVLSDEQMTEIYRRSFGLIDSRPVGPQIDFIRNIESAVLTAQAQQAKPFGWAIVDKNGHLCNMRARLDDFFGAEREQEPFDSDRVAYRDREFPGLAPHRIVTLYEAPAVASTQAKQVPSGYKLVPLQPTAEMLAATGIEDSEYYFHTQEDANEFVQKMYVAMLIAAPPAGEQPLDQKALARIARSAFDDYWHEDSRGDDDEAWEACVKAIFEAMSATQLAGQPKGE